MLKMNGRAVIRSQYGESGSAFAMRVKRDHALEGAIPLASLLRAQLGCIQNAAIFTNWKLINCEHIDEIYSAGQGWSQDAAGYPRRRHFFPAAAWLWPTCPFSIQKQKAI